jgi:integrase
LTDRFCQTAKAAEGQAQTDYWDAGCKGLALRVSSTGAKTWTFVFGWGSRRHRMRLGTYPATGLARVRTLADEARADLELGRDPRIVRGETLKAVCENYLAREGAALRTGDDRKATLARLVYPELGDRPIDDIRRSEIVRLLDRIVDTSGPTAADKALAFIRRVFNWHASRSDDFRSPIVPGMARTKPKERARKRILADDEIRVVWRVASDQGTFGRLVRFLLLTGARRSEAAAMSGPELDGADWTLTAARNKTKLDLLRPLSGAALAELPDTRPFVFSTDGGATALLGFSKAKAEFDRAVLAELRKANPEAEPMQPWRLHDLRRTARSLMSRADIASDHAELCLGHVIGGIRGTYDRYEYIDEKRNAFAKLARLVERIVNGKPTVLRLVRREAMASDA